MALQTVYGNFTKSVDAAPASQAISGVGFEPKALIMWATPQTATGIASDYEWAFGFSDGSTDYGVAGVSTDNGGVTVTNRRHASKALAIIGVGGGLLAECDLTSFDADGFTLNWTTNDGTAIIIHYLAIGGADLTDAKVGTFNAATASGNQAVTGVGFQPDIIMLVRVISSITIPQTTSALFPSFGAAISSTERWMMAYQSQTGISASNTHRRQEADGCFVALTTGGVVTAEADFVSQDADGFTINWSNPFGSTRTIGYLALKGGQYALGTETQRTSTGTRAKTGLGFQPTGLLVLGKNAVNSAVTDDHNRISIGGASAAGTEGCIWCGDTDNLGTTSTDKFTSTTKVLAHIDSDAPAGVDAEADLSSFDADGFTLDWTTADAVAREFVFLAMGSSSVAAEPIAVQLTQNVMRVPDRMVLT